MVGHTNTAQNAPLNKDRARIAYASRRFKELLATGKEREQAMDIVRAELKRGIGLVPTNSQMVLTVVRDGDTCTNLRIRECTGIPPLALNGTLGHLCRTGKLERVTANGEVNYRRPAAALAS